MSSIVFAITHHATDLDLLHVEMSSATEIVFDVNFKGLDYNVVVKDICRVAPHMMALDSDLMEMYDDAGRTRPKEGDKMAVSDFIKKYKGRTSTNLAELFS